MGGRVEGGGLFTDMFTRFAPSPTGYLHLGHALAARVAWDCARAEGGTFLVRMEDIDFTRCRPEFEAAIFEDLAWLGLKWPEPVWRQTDRFPVYESALRRLESLGVLYPCFCTRQEIAAAVSAPQGEAAPLYPGTCRHRTATEREARMGGGELFSWRLDAARALAVTGPLTWLDRKAGIQKVDLSTQGDVVLARKDVSTSYHLSVTVDDAAQEISLVTRGEDLFEATSVHRLLQCLLGLPVPEWQHHRLVRDESGKRLAKRDHARALRSLRAAGSTPEEVWGLVGC
ncbi:MAG: gluQ [Verrucomicrobiales bacterium]|nr:gluQ [Verrucomicrobiales bacterium]